MTTEEKAKAFDEALKRAKKLKETCDNTTVVGWMEYIFPKLVESEDEKIKKELISFLRLPHPQFVGERKQEKWIAWLEKQEDKDKLIKELGEYKVKYTQEVIENELERQKLYGNSIENERIKKEITNAIHELASIKNEKIDSKWLAWLEKQGQVKESSISQHEIETTSKDERIRKEFIGLVVNIPSSTFDAGGFTKEELITWLEKQGEQKPQGKTALEAAKEEKVDNANKVGPKFKVGDWIACEGLNSAYIVTVDIDKYEVEFTDGAKAFPHIEYVDRNFHLWSIQDAEDGDILTCNIDKAEIGGDIEGLPNITPTICLYWKVVTDPGYIHTYCSLYNEDFLKFKNAYYNTFVYNICPATEEQKKLLFQKIKEVGCEWNAEKKEIKRVKAYKPKFKVGDWILYSGDNYEGVRHITKIDENGYYIERNGLPHGIIPFDHEICMRLWTIQDAKNGDVLFQDLMCGKTFIYNGVNSDTAILYSFIISNDGKDVLPYHIGKPNTGIGYIEENKNIIRPATKEQRDLLFQKMKEAGCKFDFEKKELKKIDPWYTPKYKVGDTVYYSSFGEVKSMVVANVVTDSTDNPMYEDENGSAVFEKDLIEQKPAWSDEDEKRIDRICEFVWKNRKGDTDEIYQQEQDVNWLKSLKYKCIWKPTKEHVKAVRLARAFVTDDFGEDPTLSEILIDLEEQLKKLRGE